ncbi:hypothetical protein PoB_006531600 [Plakobranchus ocellatus]|uniref:SH3 domain-containing protein n=1 Tax=Plakobranchus ocellatus TaxID=259542 RepID=A0AAV4D408_9GAST|nr:hypothetical protein PoB_006531600 [Plakobranchus ocellatus]
MEPLMVGGFQLANLLLAFIVAAVFIFILYWLWTCPCRDENLGNKADNSRKYNTILTGTPVATLYAMEIEPGTVVLQSEDGEFFRILREYDTLGRTGYGSVAPEMPSCSADNQYVPSYTRAHYQTKPSAPSLPLEDHRLLGRDTFGELGTWRPINTINAAAR